MTLWRSPVRSDKPLAPVWRALARHHIGVDHRHDGQWRFDAYRVLPGNVKQPITSTAGADDLGVVIAALPDLPGLTVRLAILGALL